MSGFIDIHTHIIYGVDDGPETEEDMRALLDKANEQGIETIYATSHVTPGVKPFDYDLYNERLEKAREYCRQSGYDIDIQPGAELLYTPALPTYMLSHDLPTLGESGHILVEFVPDMSEREIENAISQLTRGGYRVIIAHIERYESMKSAALKIKRAYNVKYQVNGSSLIRKMGFFERLRLFGWFNKRLIDYVASDMHGVDYRAPHSKSAYKVLCERYGEEYADKLMKTFP